MSRKNNNITRYTLSASNDNSQPKNIFIFSDSFSKTLQMKKFNSMLNGIVAHLNSFPGSKANQLNHHTKPILGLYGYDPAILHVGTNHLLIFDKNSNPLLSVCEDIINECRNFNIGKIFISSMVFCSKVATDQLN